MWFLLFVILGLLNLFFAIRNIKKVHKLSRMTTRRGEFIFELLWISIQIGTVVMILEVLQGV